MNCYVTQLLFLGEIDGEFSRLELLDCPDFGPLRQTIIGNCFMDVRVQGTLAGNAYA